MNKRSLIFFFLLSLSLFFVNNWFVPRQVQVQESPSKEMVAQVEPKVSLVNNQENTIDDAEYYVLENEYQQLVFSTKGGSLSEINLPFETTQNEKSIVHPIKFDRKIADNYPANNFFPNRAYKVADKDGNISTVEPKKGGYTPLIRRDLFNPDGSLFFKMPERYHAFNLVKGDGSIDNTTYKVKKFTKNYIELESHQANRKITKSFSLPDNAPYAIEMKIQTEGDISSYWLTSGIPEVELISGSYSPTLQYMNYKGQKGKVEKISLPKQMVSYTTVLPAWLSNSNGFFGLIVDQLKESTSGFKADVVAGDEVPSRISLIDANYEAYPAKNYPGYEFTTPIKANHSGLDYLVYAGPYASSILGQVDSSFTNPATGASPHFVSAITFHGWFSFISEPFAKFLSILMNFFHMITHSWGFSIILLTLALRLMLYPLNAWSMKSMAKMQELQPRVTELQERYKKDPKRAQLEVMQLYKKEKANPFSGCLPLIIQLPFLIGMFDLLKSSFDLRGASFIPGWIDNLAAPDVLFSWNYPIVFFGSSFHLLPFILGGMMYLQQRLTNSAANKAKGAPTDQQKQNLMMGNVMTIVFTFMFYSMPSGLNIYWIFSTLFGILQQLYITKKIRAEKQGVEVLKS